MSEVPRTPSDPEAEIHPGEIYAPVIITLGAGAAGFAVVKLIENGLPDVRSGPDAVDIQHGEAIPTLPATSTGASEAQTGTDISPVGEVAIVSAPMLIAAVATTMWMRWRHRSR